MRIFFFRTMFFLSHGHSPSWRMSIFQMFVCFFQTLDFVIRLDAFALDNTALKWLHTLCSVLAVRYHNANYHWEVIITIFSLIWVSVLLTTFLGVAVARGTFHEYSFLRYFLRHVLPMFPTILFIPCLNVILEAFRCTTEPLTYATTPSGSIYVVGQVANSALNQRCWTPPHTAWVVLGIPTVVLMLFLSFFVLLTHSEHMATSPALVSGPHQRVAIIRLVLTFFLCGIFGPLFTLPSSHPILLSLILCIFFGIILVLRWYYLPFYRFGLCLFTVSEAAVFFWVSLLALAAASSNDAGRALGISAGMLWTLPFVVGVAILLTYTRRWDILSLVPSEITSAYVVELHVRFRMEMLHHSLRTPSYLLERELTAVEYQSVVKTCEDVYRLALVKLKRSAMIYQFYAQFAFEFRGNMHCAHRFTVWARELSMLSDIQYLSYRLIKLIELRYQTRAENREILSYMSFEHHMLLASRHDAAASRTQLQFWALLSRPKPDVAQLDRFAVTIALHNKQALSSYKKMLELNPDSPQAMRLYASFLLDVMQDKTTAQQHLELADYADSKLRRGQGRRRGAARGAGKGGLDDFDSDEDEEAMGAMLGEDGAKSMAVFDERNAIVVISGDDVDLGVVVKINARAAQLFGYSQTDFIGRHASALFAEPYTAVFSHYLYSYQDSGYPLDSLKDMFLLCRHVSAYIFPAFLHIRKFVEDGHMRILMLVEHVPTPVAIIVVQESGMVRSLSATAAALTDIDLASVAKGYHMSTAIPAYTTRVWRPLLTGKSISAGGGSGSGGAVDNVFSSNWARSVASQQQTNASSASSKAGDKSVRRFGSGLTHRGGGQGSGGKTLQQSPKSSQTLTNHGGTMVGDLDTSTADPMDVHMSTNSSRRPGTANGNGNGNGNRNGRGSGGSSNGFVEGQPLLQEGDFSSSDGPNDGGMNSYRDNPSDSSSPPSSASGQPGSSSSSTMFGTVQVTRHAGVNPFLRQAAARHDPNGLERGQHPIFGVTPALPRATIEFYPATRAEAWDLDIQMVRPPLPQSSLSVLVINYSPRPIRMHTNTTLTPYANNGNGMRPSSAVANNGRGSGNGAGVLSGGITPAPGRSATGSLANSGSSEGKSEGKGEGGYLGANAPAWKPRLGKTEEKEEKEKETKEREAKERETQARKQREREEKERENELVDDDDDLVSDMGGAGGAEGAKISDRLRRDVMQDNEGIAKGLHKFRRIFMSSVILVIGIALAAFLSTYFLLHTYRTDLVALARVTQRNYHLASCARSVHDLSLMQAGLLNASEPVPWSSVARDTSASPTTLPPIERRSTLEAVTRERLTTIAHELDAATFAFTSTVQTSAGNSGNNGGNARSGSLVSWDTINALTQASINVKFYQPSTATLYTEKMSLLDVLNLIVYHSTLVASAPLNTINISHPSVFFVTVNAASEELHAISSLADTFLERDSKYTAFVLQMVTISLVVAPILSLFLVIIFILRPTIFEIEESKSQVILVFLDIPMNIVDQLRSIYTARVETFASTKTDDGDDDDLTGVGSSGAKSGGGMSSGKIAPMDAMGEEKNDEGGDNGGPTSGGGGAGSASAGEGDKTNQDVSFSSDKYIFLGKVTLLFFIALGYFLLMYFIGINAVKPHLDNTAVQIRVAAARKGMLALSTHQLGVLASYNKSSTAVSPTSWPQPATVYNNIGHAQTLSTALVYGDSSMGITGLKNEEQSGRSTGQSELQFTNACVPPSNLYCRSFLGGVMLRGLAAAATEFISTQSRLFDSLLAEIKIRYMADTVPPPTAPPASNIYPEAVGLTSARVAQEMAATGVSATLNDWTDLYMGPALDASMTAFVNTINSEIDDATQTQMIIFIIFSIACVLVYVVVYIPLIRSLDVQIKRTRSMLLMIPADVLESIPAARKILQNKQAVL